VCSSDLRVDIINPKKAKIIQTGEANRVSLFRDVNSPNVKGRSELFLESIKTKTPKRLIDIIPQKPTKPAPRKPVDESPSILFDKPLKLDTPKETPKESGNLILLEKEIQIETLRKSAGLVFAEPKSLSLNLKSQPLQLQTESRQIGMMVMKPQLETGLMRKDMLFAEPDINKDYMKKSMDLGLLTKTGSSLKLGQIQQQAQIQTPKQEPIFFNPTITKLTTPTRPKIEIPLRPIDFGLFGGKVNPEVGGGQRGKAPSGSLFGTTKYNPSLGSILLRQKPIKVTKEQAERMRTKTYSGLELRPQIQIVKKSKKRKGLFSI
jgi:hypothetical protein